jgi:hypothetical protein
MYPHIPLLIQFALRMGPNSGRRKVYGRKKTNQRNIYSGIGQEDMLGRDSGDITKLAAP